MAARNRGPVSGRVGDTNRRLMEAQNDEKTAALASQLAQLKGLSIDIHDEV